MKTQEEFLEAEIEAFESPEYQIEFNLLSRERKNDILYKRLLFDYDDDLQKALRAFIISNGTEPAWTELIQAYPELNYVVTDEAEPVSIAKIVLKETSLE
jgi:hypothetical protein